MYKLQFSATYAPPEGETVGGDWFDILRLPGNCTFVAIGDAVGHGAAAAATMCESRRALCTAAFRDRSSPSRILEHASHMMRQANANSAASAFVGIIDERTGRLRYAAAGHPPAILASRQGARLLQATGSPLGNGLTGLLDRDVYLQRGSLLVLYTDGLTEFNHNVVEGERLLLNSVIAEAHEASASPAATIIARTLGEAKAHDDIAVLTVRVAPALRIVPPLRDVAVPEPKAAALQTLQW